jgi:glycerophosphoryl diester phosphodiesterase
MIILSHRGYWRNPEEKNSDRAFIRSFQLGFGTETDIRDKNQDLVIAHDPAGEDNMTLSNFFDLYNQFDTNPLLALNIKADGLQLLLKQLIDKHNINNYFVFDMSVPDALGYLKHGLKTFTRQSEYEPQPNFYEQASGVWLDEFHQHWINETTIAQHIQSEKQICIVSPELHRRTYDSEWQHYKEIEQRLGINNLMLCTDFPETAQSFFNS